MYRNIPKPFFKYLVFTGQYICSFQIWILQLILLNVVLDNMHTDGSKMGCWEHWGQRIKVAQKLLKHILVPKLLKSNEIVFAPISLAIWLILSWW